MIQGSFVLFLPLFLLLPPPFNAEEGGRECTIVLALRFTGTRPGDAVLARDATNCIRRKVPVPQSGEFPRVLVLPAGSIFFGYHSSFGHSQILDRRHGYSYVTPWLDFWQYTMTRLIYCARPFPPCASQRADSFSQLLHLVFFFDSLFEQLRP